MQRRLFCEICPLTYKISYAKEVLLRHLKNMVSKERFSREKSSKPLPVQVYCHNSLIRRRLGNVDMTLQENKAINLGIAAPKVNKILIKPGETFSFWQLVGKCSARKGYQTGLLISLNGVASGIGGGMCQFTNLLHWMVLHSPLTVVEHHHHNQFDLFPDFGRVVPFGVGTSILYNYKDYRVKNDTNITFQFITYVDGEYLRGELRASEKFPYKYHLVEEENYFSKEGNQVYRNNCIIRKVVDKNSGDTVEVQPIIKNHAKVLYDVDDSMIDAVASTKG